MSENILYLDCYNGLSGDMFLGALIDGGLSLELLMENLALLPLEGYRLETKKVSRYGITGTDFKVIISSPQYFRSLKDISKIINESTLPVSVKEKSLAVFKRIAAVESRIHGVSVEEVHFHEIGAVDSIIDIVGVVCGINLLDINKIISAPLPLARGLITIEHGKFPLPAPATAEILAECNIPVYGVQIEGELVTPTGAVLIAELADEFGKIPEMKMERVGYGAGNKDFGLPNFLRIFRGRKDSAIPFYSEKVNVIEANIDDMRGEISGYVMEKLLKEGALDVFFTPVQMKKNRPAIKLSVLSSPEKTSYLINILLEETTTLGCRVQSAAKVMLPRRLEEVTTPWGKVTVKIAEKKGSGDDIGSLFKFAPEYEDCLSIAQREKIPLADVYRAVESCFENEYKNR